MMGLAAEWNENNQWDWEENGNNIWLSLVARTGMGMKHWEREGVGWKKIFPLISNIAYCVGTRKNFITSGEGAGNEIAGVCKTDCFCQRMGLREQFASDSRETL